MHPLAKGQVVQPIAVVLAIAHEVAFLRTLANQVSSDNLLALVQRNHTPTHPVTRGITKGMQFITLGNLPGPVTTTGIPISAGPAHRQRQAVDPLADAGGTLLSELILQFPQQATQFEPPQPPTQRRRRG